MWCLKMDSPPVVNEATDGERVAHLVAGNRTSHGWCWRRLTTSSASSSRSSLPRISQLLFSAAFGHASTGFVDLIADRVGSGRRVQKVKCAEEQNDRLREELSQVCLLPAAACLEIAVSRISNREGVLVACHSAGAGDEGAAFRGKASVAGATPWPQPPPYACGHHLGSVLRWALSIPSFSSVHLPSLPSNSKLEYGEDRA